MRIVSKSCALGNMNYNVKYECQMRDDIAARIGKGSRDGGLIWRSLFSSVFIPMYPCHL
jgi:hypothetical protein